MLCMAISPWNHTIQCKRHLTNKHAVRSNRKHDTLVIMNAEGTPQLAHCTPQLALRLRKACLHNQQPILHSPTCTPQLAGTPQLAHPNLALPNCVFQVTHNKHSTPRLQHANALTSHSLPHSEPLQRATTAWRDQPGVASKASGGLLHAASRTRCAPQPSPRKQHS